ncbi:type I restriction-modification system endonuclease [Deinococcus multiflagellatus]|uniref:type I restriction-modification system endonuclease n=1 Tax=Deinococcus multiflagellatus TaxID=1656887 RepID=UPI001CCB000E|nr:type I restriction-modification system endonuclease [Deinococcus multiflagellatus]MBZ9715561.1 type I restriction-modification system endonuclease [Deinococcus multiflagellatus]
MSARPSASTNFAYLQPLEPQLARLGELAEKYWLDDANTALIKARQFAELLAQTVAARTGLLLVPGEGQLDLLNRLAREEVIPPEAEHLFHEIRKTGNRANHRFEGTPAEALDQVRYAWVLGVWYVRTFHEPEFKTQEFQTPVAPPSVAELTRRLQEAEEEVRRATGEVQTLLAQQQAQGMAQLEAVIQAAGKAASKIELTEAQTRQRIDTQLRTAGWDVDTVHLTYKKGTRPQKGRNLAISEWPTADGGWADYALFIGLRLVGVVEAKRAAKNVMSSLEQAKRYSRHFNLASVKDLDYPEGPWGEYRVPFLYATNGRPYLRQLQHESGIWFWDARRSTNPSKPLSGWHSPAGLLALLNQDAQAADEALKTTAMTYDVGLRPYQKQAIERAEAGIAAGQRELLLAMATGTGKTKTAITMIYRLLKARRFRRVLFLVDRSSLGAQATAAFETTRLEGTRTFAETFGLKTLDDGTPDADTAVHVATVQSFVRRLFGEPDTVPAVDTYDLIVVDEAHRGYTLDKDLATGELTWRSEDDYVSKYRRVLEHFDAVKIALTATPALHTTQIFGLPVFVYSYREAVLDGYLIDHEPPYLLETRLSQTGVTWEKGEAVLSYLPGEDEAKRYTLPDDVKIEVEGFNRQVIVEGFNKAVCQELAKHIDPTSPEKTLIFCVNDRHADDVVRLMKAALRDQYGELDEDAVVKITGASDRPLELIRRYRNEKLPTVAVTVDLLTTGVDVPAITNLVFLRRVGSRILFEQMLGRATRRDDAIGKTAFRIYDAVGAYEAMAGVTTMPPVVTQPKRTFSSLVEELQAAPDDAARAQLQTELAGKIQRLRARFTPAARAQFQAATGLAPEAFVTALRGQAPATVVIWLAPAVDVLKLLDEGRTRGGQPLLISTHEDQVISVVQAYPGGQRPDEYLTAFQTFLREHQDRLPALVTVLTRPADLTRADLKALALALDREGYSEKVLQNAYAQTKHVDAAASIIGFIRVAMEKEALQPFDARVEAALARVMGLRDWTPLQKQWLRRIADQLKANRALDRALFDEPTSPFKTQAGGFKRLDEKVFSGQLDFVLTELTQAVWAASA